MIVPWGRKKQGVERGLEPDGGNRVNRERLPEKVRYEQTLKEIRD